MSYSRINIKFDGGAINMKDVNARIARGWLDCPVDLRANEKAWQLGHGYGMGAPKFIIGMDPASKDGDLTAFAWRDTMAERMTYEALGPIESKRVLEYTVDWCQGNEAQTVLRTLDRKAAQRLFDLLHVSALRLNALGVDVCVELTTETKLVPVKKPGRAR